MDSWRNFLLHEQWFWAFWHSPCFPCQNNSAFKRKSLLCLGANALSAGLEQATLVENARPVRGTCAPFPLDLRVPIPICTICFPRETHLRDFPNEETNDTVLQLFVEPKGAPPRFELLRLANKRALSLPCNPPPGHLRKLRLSGIP
jgi:hypothetical protein